MLAITAPIPTSSTMDDKLAVAAAVCAATQPGYSTRTSIVLKSGTRASVTGHKDKETGVCTVKIRTTHVEQETVGGTHGP